jgi:hypothetical protein
MAMNKYGVLLLLLVLAPQLQATPVQALPGLPLASTDAPIKDPRQSWPSLAPVQQRELRARYAAWQALPESERARIRRAALAVAALPPQQQAALRLRFAGQDQLHRDGWRLGPGLGALYPKLQPLFGYLPVEQRAPVLALLRELNEVQLAQLVLISQRTPPQDREVLREQLLALAPAARAAWLSEKVGR